MNRHRLDVENDDTFRALSSAARRLRSEEQECSRKRLAAEQALDSYVRELHEQRSALSSPSQSCDRCHGTGIRLTPDASGQRYLTQRYLYSVGPSVGVVVRAELCRCQQHDTLVDLQPPKEHE